MQSRIPTGIIGIVILLAGVCGVLAMCAPGDADAVAFSGGGGPPAVGVSEARDDTVAASSFTDEDYQRHVEQLSQRLPHDDFTIVIQKPFVVVGDEMPAIVRRRARNTVKWASDRLKDEFFEKDPKHILDIWLFADKESYEEHAEALFGERPSTPYGYYSARHRALVMNIATGGGTLVHEIVHPFIEANLPDCPAWFNEGLGSLYEQCREEAGRIHGLTNWRLAGLQRAIDEDRLPTFEELTSMTDAEFYNSSRGANYAQARYLCFYLQEKNLLQKFYRRFANQISGDPTGFTTLAEVLGEEDMVDFQARWETFVEALEYPEEG